jgi:hypothetical protein
MNILPPMNIPTKQPCVSQVIHCKCSVYKTMRAMPTDEWWRFRCLFRISAHTRYNAFVYNAL